MTPQMGVVTDADLAAAVAAHNALTIVHGTVDDVADQTDIENHRLDPDAHHSEEIPDGRPYYGAIHTLIIPGVESQTFTVAAVTLNKIYYWPIYVRTPITIDQVTHEITAAAAGGSKARFAIYTADVNWQPGALIVASAEFAIDAIAVVTTALAVTTLQEGRYLIAVTAQATATFRCFRYGASPVAAVATTIGTTTLSYVELAAAYAALPDPGTAWDTPTFADGWRHLSWLRVTAP